MNSLATPEELKRLEARYNVTLPDVYRRFATSPDELTMRSLIGTDLAFRFVNGMKEEAAQVALESSPGFKFDANDFVFASGQGYAFLYFKCTDRQADPAVHVYEEGQSAARVAVGSFTGWVNLCRSQAQNA